MVQYTVRAILKCLRLHQAKRRVGRRKARLLRAFKVNKGRAGGIRGLEGIGHLLVEEAGAILAADGGGRHVLLAPVAGPSGRPRASGGIVLSLVQALFLATEGVGTHDDEEESEADKEKVNDL